MLNSTPADQHSSIKLDITPDTSQEHIMDKDNLFSYDNNIMLAAIISLLLVILFVLLLHLYAKWFLAQALRPSRSHSSVSVSDVLGPVRLHHHLNTFTYDITSLSSAASPAKGVDPRVISLIPLFSYYADDLKERGLECAICLSMFEEEEVGRSLPKCCHAFHVECIDMWLQSHSNCPICRAPVVVILEEGNNANKDQLDSGTLASSEHNHEAVDCDQLQTEVQAAAGNRAEEDNSSTITVPDIVIDIPNHPAGSTEDQQSSVDVNVHNAPSSSLSSPFARSRCSSLSSLSRLPASLNSSLMRILSRSRSETRIHPGAAVNG